MRYKQKYIGKYLVLEKLASGGMAEVFLARMTTTSNISRFVALKTILPNYSEDKSFVSMFEEEAKVALQLSHGNVASIYDFGIEEDRLYLAMDYVQGRNLRQITKKLVQIKKTLLTSYILYIAKEISAGLDYTHNFICNNTGEALNIVHRDVSPQNIMIDFNGSIKLIDFGIAKTTAQLEQTQQGRIKGKFSYMSPEQVAGHKLDGRTDIFSLGIIVWELITNKRLFGASSEIEVLKKVKKCHIPKISSICPDVDIELERIVHKMLEKDRNRRYQKVSEVQIELNRYLNTRHLQFNPQDFSLFLKEIYTKELISIRNALKEYAKIPISTPQTKKKKRKKTVSIPIDEVSKESTPGEETLTATKPTTRNMPDIHTVAMDENSNKYNIKSQSKNNNATSIVDRTEIYKIDTASRHSLIATKSNKQGGAGNKTKSQAISQKYKERSIMRDRRKKKTSKKTKSSSKLASFAALGIFLFVGIKLEPLIIPLFNSFYSQIMEDLNTSPATPCNPSCQSNEVCIQKANASDFHCQVVAQTKAPQKSSSSRNTSINRKISEVNTSSASYRNIEVSSFKDTGGMLSGAEIYVQNPKTKQIIRTGKKTPGVITEMPQSHSRIIVEKNQWYGFKDVSAQKLETKTPITITATKRSRMRYTLDVEPPRNQQLYDIYINNEKLTKNIPLTDSIYSTQDIVIEARSKKTKRVKDRKVLRISRKNITQKITLDIK